MPAASSPDAPLMLSVSGARGLVGLTMTPAVAADFAGAFGSFVKAGSGRASPLFCVGRDSRPSGEMLAAAALAGLAAIGGRVIDLGVVATPTVGVMIGARKADAGMVVTASHNPIAWNGLKSLNADGLAPPPKDAEAIIARFRERRIEYAPVGEIQPLARDGSANETHVQRVLDAIDPAPIRGAGLRVVLDSVNGAGGPAGRRLLDALGVETIAMNAEPTGFFAHPPEPLPEHLGDLAERVRTTGAACGFAQDPDADRLVVVDETGTCVSEECTLVLAAQRVLDRAGPGPIAANLSTSRMIDDLAARYAGTTVVRSAVGEANVADAMRSAGAVVGGEGNGGVIFPRVTWVRDSLSAMALILGLLADAGRPLSALVADLPRYTMIKRRLDLADVGGADAIAAALDRVAMAYASERIDTRDGVRVDVDRGWVHLRPSNTEPIVRLIAEARTGADARALADEVANVAGF